MRVAIVGGGLLGYLLAYHLAREGHQLSLFTATKKSGQGSASYAAAGMITPVTEAIRAEPEIYQLGMQSLVLWKKLLPTLTQTVYHQFSGSIVMSHTNDRDELRHFVAAAKRQLSHNCQVIPDITQLEPELKAENSYYFAEDGHVCARQLLSALAYELDKMAINWHCQTTVSALSAAKLSVDKHTYAFDWVFDCRGYQAVDRFKQLRAVRGELIHLHAPDVNLSRPIRLFHPRRQIYIVPQANNHYIVGASEIEAQDNSPISVRTCLELLSTAYSVHCGFAEARIIETVTGLRPALPNNLPKIEHQPGLIAINGLYRHGFLLAPALVNRAIALFKQQQ